MQINQLKQYSKVKSDISKLALCETTLKAMAEPLSYGVGRLHPRKATSPSYRWANMFLNSFIT